MTIRVFSVLAMALAISPGLAEETGLDPVSTLKVDLEKVVELRTVSPVDGITSSGQPDEAALDVFADAGYVAVIDLRGEQEVRGIDERSAVLETGMEYISMPVVGSDAINFDNASKLDQLIHTYDGPVLIHCGSGNRVGALLALRHSLNGADDEAAIKFGLEAGMTRLEGVVRERLQDR